MDNEGPMDEKEVRDRIAVINAPVDWDALVRDGMLVPMAEPGWYRAESMKSLSDAVAAKIEKVKTTTGQPPEIFIPSKWRKKSA